MEQEFEAFRKDLEEAERAKQVKLKGYHEKFRRRLKELEAERARIDDEIDETRRRIEEVERLIDGEFSDGVLLQDVVVKILPLLVRRDGIEWWSLEQVMNLVWKEKPGASKGSVRACLSRLSGEGKVARKKFTPADGGRKVFHYLEPALVTPEEQTEVDFSGKDEDNGAEPDATPPETKPPAEGEQQELLTEPEGEGEPWTDEQIREWFIDKLAKHPDGIDNKLLAWLVAENRATPEAISGVLQQMESEGLIESVNEGGTELVRTPAKEGSKEELKRLKIQDKPLFAGVQKPDHA
jgi:hypothetical protein